MKFTIEVESLREGEELDKEYVFKMLEYYVSGIKNRSTHKGGSFIVKKLMDG